jgi:hypothetical protein
MLCVTIEPCEAWRITDKMGSGHMNADIEWIDRAMVGNRFHRGWGQRSQRGPITFSAFRNLGLCLAIVSLVSFFGSGNLLSNEQCAHPDIFGSAFVPPKNRLGEFRLVLKPPDYGNTVSVQHHLAYSMIWARIISGELAARTRGFCEAVITPPLFPDLRVYLIMNRSPGDMETERSVCTSPLDDIIQTSQPTDQAILKSASVEAERILQRIRRPGNDIMLAYNILVTALTRIYRGDTVMYALVSVNAATYQSLDLSTFREWLQRQRSGERIELTSLPMCSSKDDQAGSVVEIAPGKPPPSGTIPGGSVKVSATGAVSPSMPQSFRHVVIVGDGGTLYAPFPTPATIKYCDRDHLFEIDPASKHAATVRVRCFRAGLYSEPWVLFFCDPKDCPSDNIAKGVASAIAKDADVIALARERSGAGQLRGPYLTEIQTSGD